MLSVTNESLANTVYTYPNTFLPLQHWYKHSFVLHYLFKLPLQPVKRWVGYILSLYVLFCAVVPCTIIDNCEDDQKTEQTSKQEEKKDCNNCSPFSICSASHGFTLATIGTTVEPIVFNSSPAYSDYYFSAKSEYHPSLFQPPRAG